MSYYDTIEAVKAQKKYCEERGFPHFAPLNGKCYSCNRDIYQPMQKGKFQSGVTVEAAGNNLITGCPHCNRSYCD